MSCPGTGCRRRTPRRLESAGRARAGGCPSCAAGQSTSRRRPAGAHEEGAVRIDACDNAVSGAFNFQPLKMADGQSLAHLPGFLREKLEKANAGIGVRSEER